MASLAHKKNTMLQSQLCSKVLIRLVYFHGISDEFRLYNVLTHVSCSLQIEETLSKSRYLLGDRLTVADIRLFTTLIRFDPVYVGHFKVESTCI